MNNFISDILLWKEAKKVIPSGNLFLSKNYQRLPKCWPIYYKNAKGISIKTLNNNFFLDFSYMGVGTNSLGYSNSYVNKKVKEAIFSGNMCTLNNPDEIKLAKTLLKIHSWAKMVKFTRGGGEANAIAIRIARAFNKKSKVVICGYHGWHDWYLSATLSKKNSLDTHLFPNLKNSGVPSYLKNKTLSFLYNDFDSLKKIVKFNKNQISCLIMEVERDKKPNNNFLKKIRKICTKHKIVLIFDECTSGFRETFGGLHLKYKVYPDIAMFGKSIGNGYAINAVIGRSKIMKSSLKTFISSTFWSEKIGTTAALATIREMKRLKSWVHVKRKGKFLKKKLNEICKRNNIKIKIYGMDSIIKFDFLYSKNKKILEKFSYEMLKRNILATNLIYVSYAHKNNHIKYYLKSFEEVVKKILKF